MTHDDFDNIPLLDDLIAKGDIKEQTEQDNLTTELDLEQKVHDILQRHTSQATAEILAIINAKSNNFD